MSAVTLLFFAGCGKKSSPDPTLQINYTPSVIISSDNYIVYAMDPVTGKKNWEYDGLHAPVYASPLVYNGMVYIATQGSPTVNGDTLYKLNAKTGQLVKKMVIDPNAGIPFGVWATPIADNNLIYVAGYDNGTLYALDTGTGNIVWSCVPDGSVLQSSPTIYNGKLYIATLYGTVDCIDKTHGMASGGIPIWSIVLAENFTSSPAVAPPYLYIGGSIDSNMYCIYLDEPTVPATGVGAIRWTYKAHGAINSSPSAYDGRCIFGCDDFGVYCLDTSINPPGKLTPTLIWKAQTNGHVASSPYSYNQVVYIGSDDAFVYALNIINGGIKWKFQTNGPITSSPLVYNGIVYAGSADRNIYAVDSVSGTLKWFFNVNGIIRCSPTIDNLTGAQINSQISGYTNAGYPN